MRTRTGALLSFFFGGGRVGGGSWRGEDWEKGVNSWSDAEIVLHLRAAPLHQAFVGCNKRFLEASCLLNFSPPARLRAPWSRLPPRPRHAAKSFVVECNKPWLLLPAISAALGFAPAD